MNSIPIILAADIGGTHISLAIVEEGKILDLISIDAHPQKGMKAHLNLIEEAARTLIDRNSLSFTKLSGFGIALPMLVDPTTNRVVSTAERKYEDAKEIDFDQWAKDKFGLKVKLEVDGNAGCLGEWFYGAGKGIKDIVYVILGTGYGSSVILRGHALRGRNYTAGMLGGHLVVNPGGNKCVCPGRGCIEAETGTWALAAIARQTSGFDKSILAKRQKIDYKALIEDRESGDSIASEIFDRSINYWGASLVNMTLCYNPQKIILAGGIMRASKHILPKLDEYVKKQLWTTGEYPEIVVAEHMETAALLGAYAMVAEHINYI